MVDRDTPYQLSPVSEGKNDENPVNGPNFKNKKKIKRKKNF